MMVRKPEDVPAAQKTAKAVLQQQQMYEGFITEAKGQVGELTLEAGEALRSIKVKLRRAATRAGAKLDIWDVDGKVYFQAEAPSIRRGRLRKTA